MSVARMHREPPRTISHIALFSSRSWVRHAAPSLALATIFAGACAPRRATAPSPSAATVTFVKRAPKIGRVTIEESSTNFRLSGEAKVANGAPVGMTTETIERERRREEVLAVFERIITKKKITYELIEKRELRDGKPVPTAPSPLAGHSYIAETKYSALIVTNASGAPVSAPEQRELARRLASVGKPDPFLEGIPDGPIRTSQAAPTMSQVFLEIFEAGEQGGDVGKVDVRFAGLREKPQGQCGIFAFSLEVQMAGEPRLALQLRGEFLVRISDSAPIEFEMQGPARLVGRQNVEGRNVALEGTGAFYGTWRATYL